MLKMKTIRPKTSPTYPILSLSLLITAEAPNPTPNKPKNIPKKKMPTIPQAIEAIAVPCDIFEVAFQPQSGQACHSLFRILPHFGQTLSTGGGGSGFSAADTLLFSPS